MAREALTRKAGLRLCALAGSLLLAVILLAPIEAARHRQVAAGHPHVSSVRPVPYPQLALPIELSGAQYVPVAWSELAGWDEDDHLQAFKTFRASCKPISGGHGAPADRKALGSSLRVPCRAARAVESLAESKAKAFFERHFVPLRISRLGEEAGFVTGYYEPVIEGARMRSELYPVPLYRRPSNLFVRGFRQGAPNLPNKGEVFRKIGRRKLVPYYDRAEIEDGAIAGRGLEICWVKNQTDLLFAQIQGSARVRLEDGSTIRINYDAHNGYPYTPVGRLLIERGLIPREQMSMQKIREWMEQNPDGANELRRQNRSYVFFREVRLLDKDEPIGAQGVPLTAGRSIAVDQALHVYGTPFFIEGELPIESEHSNTPFHRLMIAQDTGSAIVGPARADLYFGAGGEAGRVSGRLRHSMRFTVLVPKSLDPVARGRKLPLPDSRPSEAIAKVVPQLDPSKDQPSDGAMPAPGGAALGTKDGPVATGPTATQASTALEPISKSVPIPEARPKIEAQDNQRGQMNNHHSSP